MTDAKAYAESDGVFDTERSADRKCPKCQSPMSVKVWESSCGGYEDEKFTCSDVRCGHHFWVDGPDS